MLELMAQLVRSSWREPGYNFLSSVRAAYMLVVSFGMTQLELNTVRQRIKNPCEQEES